MVEIATLSGTFPPFKIEHLDFVSHHPKVLSLEAAELGEDLKSGLSCLARRSDFGRGDDINQEVDKLALAIETRLLITEELITY